MKVQAPKPQTLRKYGLTLQAWQAILRAQGGACAVCRQVPKTGRLVTDHEHVKGWKKMPPEQRKLYVRGLLCWWCNHAYLGRGITLYKARGVVAYLMAYKKRRGVA